MAMHLTELDFINTSLWFTYTNISSSWILPIYVCILKKLVYIDSLQNSNSCAQ